MLRTKFQLSFLFLAVFLSAMFTTTSYAEIEKIQIQLFGGSINNYDARQIRRLLSRWVDPENVTFYNDVDDHGRESAFTTIVEIIPRRAYVDVYDIIRQLKDQRFRGKPAGGLSWVVKTEATVSGDLFTYPGWSRSYIRNAPAWRRWRPTSAVNHALDAGGIGQKIVFSDNKEYDKLRQEAGRGARNVEIKGQITGFDGPYPVMSVRQFRVKHLVEPPINMREKAEGTEETPKEEPEETPEGANK